MRNVCYSAELCMCSILRVQTVTAARARTER